jgi:aryl-alcohol dehydrogenase-like predicted oxidoreductase
MRYRTLGGTGIQVSVHCLGAMMFGAVGNADHDDCVRIVRAALDQGINSQNAAKLEAVEQLAALARDIGCSLPQLAVAFTVAHPAVTSAIIGRGPWNTWMGC